MAQWGDYNNWYYPYYPYQPSCPHCTPRCPCCGQFYYGGWQHITCGTSDSTTIETQLEEMKAFIEKHGKKDEDENLDSAKIAQSDVPDNTLTTKEEQELLGWEDCMRGKIVRHYGPEVEACVKSVTHSHSSWTSILKCIVAIKGITNPEIWIPEQI